jgi:hypothetical protein
MTTEPTRLVSLIKALERKALDGSAALPQGRGGRTGRDRDEAIDLYAREARGLAAIAEAKRPTAVAQDRIDYINGRKKIATGKLMSALMEVKFAIERAVDDLDRGGGDVRLDELDQLGAYVVKAAKYNAEREALTIALHELLYVAPEAEEVTSG